MFWGVVNFEAFGQTPGFFRWERFVPRCRIMGFEIIQHHSDLGRPWIAFVEHPPDETGPILTRAGFGDLNVPPPAKRFYFNKNVAHFVTNACGCPQNKPSF